MGFLRELEKQLEPKEEKEAEEKQTKEDEDDEKDKVDDTKDERADIVEFGFCVSDVNVNPQHIALPGRYRIRPFQRALVSTQVTPAPCSPARVDLISRTALAAVFPATKPGLIMTVRETTQSTCRRLCGGEGQRREGFW